MRKKPLKAVIKTDRNPGFATGYEGVFLGSGHLVHIKHMQLTDLARWISIKGA